MIDKKHIVIIFLAVITSWFAHEFAQWFTGTLLGYDMRITLNTAYSINENAVSNAHKQLISAAGPLFTILQAIFVYFFIKKYHYFGIFLSKKRRVHRRKRF